MNSWDKVIQLLESKEKKTEIFVPLNLKLDFERHVVKVWPY